MSEEKNTNRENIFIESDEEIPSIISKIKNSDTDKISLVIPRNSSLTQGLVNLKIIKKQVLAMGKKLTIVTCDAVGQNLASQLDIEVYENIASREPVKDERRVKPRDEVLKIDKSSSSAPVAIHHFQEGGEEGQENLVGELESAEDASAGSGANELLKKPQELPVTVPLDDYARSRHFSPDGKSPEKILSREEPERYESQTVHLGKPKLGRINIPRIRLGRFKPVKLGISFVFIILVLGLVYLFTPRAKLTFVVLGESFADSLNLEVDSSVKVPSVKEMKIPGHLLEAQKESEGTFSSSGKKNVGEKARGKVTLKNSWHQDPQVILAGTVLTKDDLQFLTIEDATVPGATLTLSNGQVATNAGVKDVLIEAQAAGESYNVKAGKFEILSFPAEKRVKFFGESQADLSGGSTREVKVVSSEDIEKAKQDILAKIKDDMKKEMREKNQDKTILDDAIEFNILKEAPSVSVNTEAENFKMTLSAQGSALSFDKNAFKQTFIDIVKTRLPAGKDLRVQGSDEIATSVKNLDLEDKKMVLTGEIKTRVSPLVDEQKLKKAVFGKKASEAKAVLEADPAVEEAKIELTPVWLLYRLPYFAFQYQCNVEYKEK
ncbi:hypothetical protein CO101_02335 [Candidatus Berkelbacteria bacterium CG_4_9_14_3_um_filter_39_23]|uniref:Baseplate protein J-like barrel domain-containing protein n=2 Tax=Candidatus Berkelbacteria TaxID=1618330 RepID=A0A2M7CIW4_9BACT|nr:hypothetical protein [Candidatus Berkelbacteria bacterium]OIP04915.1 MAG: hypothetical protein AUK14_02390 [Candidatus Berkelbacteria bacterium CG2_30_39_44]PIR27605.1 MAG: hypothetical protein COV39_03610 [Candidatus Berkelbacteria bacterium CG11_big_fil_rev_8_21_14_0_20_40_23]PIV25564.1 MAG: hypothetical protein COS38_01000 [Candidatus Berkelbacteria bacterium CG03_land_8_20_14_0_80_40_36]PIX30687.1 MAG: hypothetical protein COZ62_01310 [Candidatus Berkelbacteria bacterium CG_4_8_14_3_um_f